MANEIRVVLVFEDELSEAVLRRLLKHSKRPFVIDRVIHSHGNGRIKAMVPVFKNACKALPHVVLTDLDRLPCTPQLLHDWDVGALPAGLLFRVAERETEAWLLADRSGMASFLGVPINKVSNNPDTLEDPKQALLSLARRGSRRRLAQELLPAPGSRVSIGPLYNQRLCGFVCDIWDVDAAKTMSPSLARAVNRLVDFMK